METRSEKDHLIGDWGGWRTRLVERGVHFQAGYIAEVLENLSGGLRRGAVYEGLAEGAIEFDLERMTHVWKGALIRASALYPHGRGSSRELVGDLQTVSNIDAYDSPALYELWFQQMFWNDHFSVRIGQLLADAEFATTESSGALLNSAFGWPAFISSNTRNTGPAFFRAGPGVRLRFDPIESLYAQVAVYDGDTLDSDEGDPSANRHGVNFRVSGHQGAFGMAEIGWRLHQAKDATGLPGTYKIGAWGHTGDFSDQFDPTRVHQGNFGFYIGAEQKIWNEADSKEQGLELFFRGGISPNDRSLLPLALDGGLHYTGLIPSRDEDTLTFGVALAQVSDDLRRGERAANAAVLSDHEIAVELTYQINLRSWLTVQPDFQWVRHPGGSRALDDAFVIGLRSRVTF